MSSINFVSQETLDEARKERQEEWDKAYKNSENPPAIQEEVPYDPRTLYERLQEQKQKKDDAFAEATKFGNLIHRIDNDEFDFLSTLENEEAQKKRDLADQEAKDLEAFRQNQLKTQPLPEPTPIGSASAVPSFTSSLAGSSAGAKKNKKSLFGGLVKRKGSEHSTADDSISSTAGTKGEKDESGSHSSGKRKEVRDESNDKEHENKKTKVATTSASKPAPSATATTTPAKPVAQKAGLLGLVAYDSSSDEDDE